MGKSFSLKKDISQSKNIFWFLVLLIWMISTFVDRIWWNSFSDTPSWDQADYLNSALDHARALSFIEGEGWNGMKSFLDLSPKIPPLASIFNGAVIAIAGDSPHKAAWSLSIWNGFLLFNIASWGLYLKGQKFSLVCVLLTAISPFIMQLRTDYVLELPLISVTTFYLFHLGKWSAPNNGGKWIQLLITSIACVASLLIKQSSLLVVIPSLFLILILSFTRKKIFRVQFLCLFLINILAVLPWFYHNWIMTLSGTYRAVFESARIEGDPSLFAFESIFWYFPFLKDQFGGIIFGIGSSGIVLLILNYVTSSNASWNLKNLFFNRNYKWTWVSFNLLCSWTFTTFIPNKDPRYIATSVPLIILFLALGFSKWNDWLGSYMKLVFKYLLFVAPLSFSLFSFVNRFIILEPIQNKYYPVDQIISEIKLNQNEENKETIIVIPSTPEVNQHNVSYIGRMQGGNILGRQLGQSLLHKQPVLEQANWIILAEGDQGSVPENSLIIDNAIRKSGFFYKIREFPRKIEGSYSLWKRSAAAPDQRTFDKRFIELAMGMSKGPLGIKSIFEEIAIQHMIDGHFEYQSIVKNKAILKTTSNPNDIEALWTLSLLKILANRPIEADIYLEKLEDLIPQNPWPSAYRSIVNLASWNPLKASKIADQANKKHRNQLLKGLADVGAVIGGRFWRIPSSLKSVPAAIVNIEQDSKSNLNKSNQPNIMNP